MSLQKRSQKALREKETAYPVCIWGEFYPLGQKAHSYFKILIPAG